VGNYQSVGHHSPIIFAGEFLSIASHGHVCLIVIDGFGAGNVAILLLILRKLLYRMGQFTECDPTASGPLSVQCVADPVGLSASLARSPAAYGITLIHGWT